jgi:hypothetical protein
MDLSPDARTMMEALRERFVAAGFPNPWYWPIDAAEVGAVADELLRLGLLGPMDTGKGLRLTDAGLAWVLESRGLVAVYCPKCSTDVCIPKGQPQARAVCPVCSVWWTEDTTVVPFVPRYG